VYITANHERSTRAIAGGVGDKSVDPFTSAKGVFIVQGKYRQNLLGKGEPSQ
jgi:hypothetical protein